MARFLATLWPIPGHLHPNLAIATRLRARGHDVAFFTGASARALIEGEGFAFFPFETLDERHVEDVLVAAGATTHRWRDLPKLRARWREWAIGTVPAQLADLDPVLARWQPDVIICDPAFWGPILVTHEKGRVPVAVFSYVAACLVPGRDSPVFGWTLPRARSWYARLGVRLVRAALGLATRDFTRAANALRRQHRLRPLDSTVMVHAATMPLYLQQSTPEFDYNRRDLPPNVHYVGPCPWDRPSREPPPAFLSRLPRDRPWVYVTDGTMHAEPRVTRAALAGLGDLPIQIIVTTGKRHSRTDLGTIPANAWIEEFIPHGDLFPLVDLVITTGGTGTVLKALGQGVPLLTVPWAWDQGENAWRVEAAGAGLRLSPRQCTPERIRGAVQRILGDPSFRQNARRFPENFARYGGAACAAELLGDLAAATSPGPIARAPG